MKQKKLADFLKKDIVILAILFVFGLFFVSQYSEHLDQVTEQRILYSNVLSYCQKTGAFPGLAKAFMNDGIVPIEVAIDRDHGAAVFYPITWIYAVNNYNSFWGNIIWHTYIYCFNFLAVIALYYLVKEIFDKKIAIISTLLYFLTPAMFAQAHYNNKDMVLLSLAVVTFYTGFKMTQKEDVKWAILFGVSGAFFANMKIIGIPMWGFVLVCTIAERIIRKKFNKKLLLAILISTIVALGVYCLITPAIWSNPIEYIVMTIDQAKNYRWMDYVLFNGHAVSSSSTGIPRKYLPVMITLTTPIGILILMVLGLAGMVKAVINKKAESKILYGIYAAICGLIPLAYGVLSAAVVYNGWRHFYFVYASMILFAAFGVYFVLSFKKEKIFIAILAAYTLFLLSEVIAGNPYQYGYYNEFARFFVEDRFETDYWDMSFKQAVEYIAKNDSSEHITLSGCDNPTRWGINPAIRAIRGRDRLRLESIDDWMQADYVLVNYGYAKLYSQEDLKYLEENRECVKVFKTYGNKMSAIYH